MSVLKQARRLIVPEVVQTSAMDCGPASLRCLLAGFGIPLSYGRLREACQTDVDGTSINTIEETAAQLGLDAEQIMLPLDHLLIPEAQALPAVVVVRLANGNTHFVVAWRRHGPLVQVMDPGTGRRWPTARRFLDQVFVHSHPVPAAAWRDWSGSEEFVAPLARRLRDLRLSRYTIRQLIDEALDDPEWEGLGTLDAAARMVASLVRSRGLLPGGEAARVLRQLSERTSAQAGHAAGIIPDAFWSVRPVAPEANQEAKLILRGAVLVRARGRRSTEGMPDAARTQAPLSPELAAAMREPEARPGREFLRLMLADGAYGIMTSTGAVAAFSAAVVLEDALLRSTIDVGRFLSLPAQRIGAFASLLVFSAAVLLLDTSLTERVLRFGRRLEARLRMAFLQKLPRIADRYFHSRLASDMAERSHRVHLLHLVPFLAERGLRHAFVLVATAAAVIWLDPASAPLAILSVALILAVLVVTQPLLAERDLRVRSHVAALLRFHLDSLLGLVPVRTHGAERAVQREHDSLVVEWARARLGLHRASVVVAALVLLLGFGLAGWLLYAYLERGGGAGRFLLLVYWTLNLPTLGQALSLLAREYPLQRNTILRLLEPLGAPEDECPEDVGRTAATSDPDGHVASAEGVAILMEGVAVRATGHTILEDIDVDLQPGTHVGVVGRSGAGKSSLVGLLLGWHRPAKGRVLTDGSPLDAQRLAQLRRETAWVDPAVHIWNRSLLENLRYGATQNVRLPIEKLIEQADLGKVLDRLPKGLQTVLGESGGLVSGGEGQRVRLGRALCRPEARLVILDEAFRGLDRPRSRELLTRARSLWREATLLCITHDLEETKTLDHVLVMDGGRIVEQGTPTDLAENPDSRYRAMLDAELATRRRTWASGGWRRLHLENGRLISDDTTRRTR